MRRPGYLFPVQSNSSDTQAKAGDSRGTVVAVLVTLSACHLINDTMQAIIPAIYPMLKERFSLTFTQIGLITLCSQTTASILRPVIGNYTDRRPQPFSLAAGMAFPLAGLALLSRAGAYPVILMSTV